MRIEFKRLTEVDKSDIIELMTHPLLRKHMPLLGDIFDEAACDAFITGKMNDSFATGYTRRLNRWGSN